MVDAKTWNEKVLDSQGNIYYCKSDCYLAMLQEIYSLVSTLKKEVSQKRVSYESIYNKLDDICETFIMADGDKIIYKKD